MINSIPESYREFLKKINFASGLKLISFAAKIRKIKPEILINRFSGTNKLFYWNQPWQKIEFLAVGNVKSITANGFERTSLTEEQFKQLFPDFISNHAEFPDVTFPVFMGGLKFAPDLNKNLWDDYEDSDWFIPEFVIYSADEDCYVIYNTFTGNFDREAQIDKLKEFLGKLQNLNGNQFPVVSKIISTHSNEDDKNEKEIWINNIESALNTIRQSDLHKVVLARKVTTEISGFLSFDDVVTKLSNKYPDCYTFLYKSGASFFFGASPEKLVKFNGGWIESDALAGSAPRGSNENEDKRIAEELLSSAKNLTEQKAVTEFIARSFSYFSDEIIYPENPVIKKLPNIQHLFTPVKAKLKEEKTIFKIIHEIHPTPAICGTPLMKAFQKITELEEFERGLYSGTVGWFNFNCIGEFAVAIRSGLLKENKIYAFAGCGIVEGSDPAVEYEETRLKLQPILSLFKDEKITKS